MHRRQPLYSLDAECLGGQLADTLALNHVGVGQEMAAALDHTGVSAGCGKAQAADAKGSPTTTSALVGCDCLGDEAVDGPLVEILDSVEHPGLVGVWSVQMRPPVLGGGRASTLQLERRVPGLADSGLGLASIYVPSGHHHHDCL
jgi:hypothetical protein